MTSENLKQAWAIESQRRRNALKAFEALHKDVLEKHARLREQTMCNMPSNVLECTYCDTWEEDPGGQTLPQGWAWVKSACCDDDMLCCPTCTAKGPRDFCGNCVRM